MAKPSWVKLSQTSGSGNANVSVSGNEHTGRVAREGYVTWKAANVTDVPRKVVQAGKPEYVDIDDNASADQAGKRVTISGVSNSKRLTFTLGTGDLSITLPGTYTANSATTSNGATVSGDPGATAQYNFSIVIDVPANPSTSELTRQIIVTDDGGHRDVCLLTSAAGDAYITIREGDIELDYLGTAVTIAVQSNTSWTIE